MESKTVDPFPQPRNHDEKRIHMHDSTHRWGQNHRLQDPFRVRRHRRDLSAELQAEQAMKEEHTKIIAALQQQADNLRTEKDRLVTANAGSTSLSAKILYWSML